MLFKVQIFFWIFAFCTWMDSAGTLRAIYAQDSGTKPNSSIEGESALKGVIDQVMPSVVTIKFQGLLSTDESFFEGSGFIISQEGEVVSSSYLIEKGLKSMKSEGYIYALFNEDIKPYRLKLLGMDRLSGVALLKIEALGNRSISYVKQADIDKVSVGDFLIAVGNPFGFSHSVTLGIVSAKATRYLESMGEKFVIQTDAAINPGHLGGPLFNLRGEVVGMNAFIYSPLANDGQNQKGSIRLGFALPVDAVMTTVKSIKTNTAFAAENLNLNKGKGWLGVALVDTVEGVLVSTVFENSPAYNNGIRPGDIIKKINDEDVSSVERIIQILSRFYAGDEVKLEFISTVSPSDSRDTVIMNVKLDERPTLLRR